MDAVEESLTTLTVFVNTEFSLSECERSALMGCLERARRAAINDEPSTICYRLREFVALIEDDERWDAETVYKAVAHAALALAE